MPTPIPCARPFGLGNAMARAAASVVIGLALLWFLVSGLRWLVETAILEGWV